MAAKPNKRKVAEALTEYQQLSAQILIAEAAYQEAVAPAKARFDKAVAEPLAELEAVRKPRLSQLARLQKLVESELLLGVNEDGTAVLPQVIVPGAIAKVAHSTVRTIDPEAWIEATPPKARDSRWYKCVSILITQVDKQFGTDFAHLIETVRKPRVTIELVKEVEVEEAA